MSQSTNPKDNLDNLLEPVIFCLVNNSSVRLCEGCISMRSEAKKRIEEYVTLARIEQMQWCLSLEGDGIAAVAIGRCIKELQKSLQRDSHPKGIKVSKDEYIKLANEVAEIEDSQPGGTE